MRSLVIILSLLVVPFTHAAGTIQTNGIFGGLLLGGTTNIISDNGTTLTRNGSAISGAGGIVGTVSNNVASAGLLAVDDTKTNGIAATAAHVTNAWGIFTGDTNSFVNGAGHLSAIYNVVTNYTLTGTNGITVTGSTNSTNVTITIGDTNALAWGTISGNIASQTDLATALTNKVLKSGDTITGMLTNNAGYAITNDIFLVRDSGDTLALRRSTNPQTLRVYNTYTDASNYEALRMFWSGNILYLGTVNAGSGFLRNLVIQGLSLTFGSTGADWWKINSSGNFLAGTDNSFDIGASGATRPRNVYVAGSVFAPYSKDGNVKVLTSSTAADFLYISVPNTNTVGGRVLWTVNATDGTESQQQTGETKFGAVAKGTAVTAGLTTLTNAAVVSSGTLTMAVAANTATNNVFALGVTATTSLTTTNLTIRWRLETPSTFTVNVL